MKTTFKKDVPHQGIDFKSSSKTTFSLEEFRTFFLTQKDILLKHFNISLISMSNDSNYIIELNKFLEDFNIIFDKINSSLKSIDILKKKLDIAKSSLLDSEEKINEYINSYNESYISDFPKLLDCMNYTIDFIEKLFVTPTYEKSKERTLEMFYNRANISKNDDTKNKNKSDSLNIDKESTKHINKNEIKDVDKTEKTTENEIKSKNSPTTLSNISNTETLTTVAINKLDLENKDNDIINHSKTEFKNEVKQNKNNIDTINESNESENKNKKMKNEVLKDTSRVTKLPLQDNNNLIISEKDGLVYLPFKVEDLKKEYIEKHKKYKGLIDLINHEYILPINKYKNTVTSRFKEAYSLMVNKEKESALSGLELGLEVAFNYSLHPAVISACKSLNELDEYLDALDAKDMSSFKRFKVEFEVLPK